MYRTIKGLAIIGIVMLMLLAACDGGIPVTGDEAPPAEEEAQPVEPEEANVPDTATPTSPPTATPTTEPPTEVPAVTPTPRPPPVHMDFPGGAIYYDAQQVSDCKSGGSRKEGDPVYVGAGCDVWEQNILERPLDMTLVGYNPNLDIVQQQFGNYEGWYYARMLVYQDPFTATDLNNTYGIEIDLDIDNDGDLLIYVINPESLDENAWSAERVYVWEDRDDDVGGATRVAADDAPFEGTGYEVKLFESGYGDDPDLAWARIAPAANYAVEFAFKDELIGGNGTFLWWMWAGKDVFFPGMFDYVDTMLDTETYDLDNTCRWLFGIPPQDLANICPYYKPGPESAPGQCFCPPCNDPTGAQCPPCSCP